MLAAALDQVGARRQTGRRRRGPRSNRRAAPHARRHRKHIFFYLVEQDTDPGWPQGVDQRLPPLAGGERTLEWNARGADGGYVRSLALDIARAVPRPVRDDVDSRRRSKHGHRVAAAAFCLELVADATTRGSVAMTPLLCESGACFPRSRASSFSATVRICSRRAARPRRCSARLRSSCVKSRSTRSSRPRRRAARADGGSLHARRSAGQRRVQVGAQI